MEKLLLALFFVCEIGLFIYTVAKKSEKKEWGFNKLLVRGAELLIFIVLLLTPAVALNIRFTMCFIILIVRIIFSAVSWLISKTKSGRKHPALAVLNIIANIFVLVIAVVPAFLFSDYEGLATTGNHKVASTSFILIDGDREDPFEGEGSRREVPVYAFYPEDGGTESEYPLVIFSHGAFGYYQSNMSAYQELASNGYVVLSLDHPHHSIFTKNTRGEIVTVDQNFINNVMMVNGTDPAEEEIFALSSEWVKLRIDDENFVIDEIKNVKATKSIPSNWYTEGADEADIYDVLSMADADNIGLFGHSLGGATAVTVGRMRDDVNAVIDLDGTMLGEQLDCEGTRYVFPEEPYPVPLLSMESEIHHTQAEEIMLLYVNRYICSNAKDARTIWFKGSEHMNFTDLPLFSPVLAKALNTGTIDAESCITQMNGVILDYFNYYLKGEGELTLKECYE